MTTQQEYRVHFQKSQQKYAKIQILNSKDIIVDEIETEVIGGNNNLDAMSSIRRVCDLELKFKSNFIPSPSSQIWLNKRFRLWLGIKDILTDEIVWFNRGIYVISNPRIDIQIGNETISIKGYDKSCLLDGTITGELEEKRVIEEGAPIHELIKDTAILGGETKLLIDNHDYTVPYRIEKEAGSTIWELLDELRKLYMDWELYYDVNGYLRFNKIRNKLNDTVIHSFTDDELITAKTIEIDFENIKNNIIVYGKLLDNGIQVKSQKTITDINSPNSPFTIEKIGKRNLIINDTKYYTDEACTQRANYETWKHTNFNEKVSISCVPLLFLGVNRLVEFNAPEHNLYGKYLIENISLGLKHDDIMHFTAWKVY